MITPREDIARAIRTWADQVERGDVGDQFGCVLVFGDSEGNRTAVRGYGARRLMGNGLGWKFRSALPDDAAPAPLVNP